MENKQYKRIAVEHKIATQMQEIARKKGVSLGVYVEAMMNYVLEKNIDYTDKEPEDIRKHVERVVKILRVFEREYFIPTSNNMKVFIDGIETEEQTELEQSSNLMDVSAKKMITDDSRERELERELNKQTLAIRKCEWLINKAVDLKGKIVIELSRGDFEDCKNSLRDVL